MIFTVDIEREDDGRWLAEVPALAGEFVDVTFQAA
jgi:predicted RNase H-like HicB family nuclease